MQTTVTFSRKQIEEIVERMARAQMRDETAIITVRWRSPFVADGCFVTATHDPPTCALAEGQHCDDPNGNQT